MHSEKLQAMKWETLISTMKSSRLDSLEIRSVAVKSVAEASSLRRLCLSGSDYQLISTFLTTTRELCTQAVWSRCLLYSNLMRRLSQMESLQFHTVGIPQITIFLQWLTRVFHQCKMSLLQQLSPLVYRYTWIRRSETTSKIWIMQYSSPTLTPQLFIQLEANSKVRPSFQWHLPSSTQRLTETAKTGL
jgi:hypothetical protein